MRKPIKIKHIQGILGAPIDLNLGHKSLARQGFTSIYSKVAALFPTTQSSSGLIFLLNKQQEIIIALWFLITMLLTKKNVLGLVINRSQCYW